jgi:16S rRNA (guanine527-N7)-methyltransferase
MGQNNSHQLPELNAIWRQTLNWQPSIEQQRQFQQLYEGIREGNQRLNLTRITQPEEFWEKHLWDSLRGIARFLQESVPYKAIDIGTGAGFPGLPVAIAQPNWSITLLDSTRKKMDFLNFLLDTLKLSNAHTLVGRVEAIGQEKKYRENYDLALVRAVAEAGVCAEYALPLLKLGGVAVLYRGQWTDAERRSLQPVASLLGGTIEHIEAFSTPLTGGERHCLYLRKVFPTPEQFPRAIGIPVQKPLGHP